MLATGTRTKRPLSSVRLSSPPSARAWRTVSDTCSGVWSDSNVISRATFCTPILTSTALPFVSGACPPGPRAARAAGFLRRLTRRRGRTFPARDLAVPAGLGEAAKAPPGQGSDQSGGLVAGDGRALRQPEAGADLGHAGERHAQQVRLGLGQAGVLADDHRDGLGAVLRDLVDTVAHGGLVGQVGLEDQPVARPVAVDEVEVGLDARGHAELVVAGARQGASHELDELLGGLVQQRAVEVELAGEVLVEDRLGDPRPVG